jgi:hypothetical protein
MRTFFLSVSFNFPCHLTRCRLGDFDMIFITQFLNSNISICALRVSLPQRKNLGAPIHNYGCKERTLGLVELQLISNEQLLSQIIRQSRNHTHKWRKWTTHMWYFGLIHTCHFCFLGWFWRRISVDLHPERGGDTVSSIVTRYMQDSSGFEPQWGKKFSLLHTHTDRSWGPHSLLYNG